jgi:hypothetical protein
MLKLFNLFNIDEKYFADKKTVKKRFIKVFGGFLLIATAISPFTWMGFLFFLLLLFEDGTQNLTNFYF